MNVDNVFINTYFSTQNIVLGLIRPLYHFDWGALIGFPHIVFGVPEGPIAPENIPIPDALWARLSKRFGPAIKDYIDNIFINAEACDVFNAPAPSVNVIKLNIGGVDKLFPLGNAPIIKVAGS